jgi:Ca2+-binding EF-hand superfamily protein
MDVNPRDKQLSINEVRQYLSANGFTYKNSELNDFWAQSDTNRDGFLTVHEIKEVLRN